MLETASVLPVKFVVIVSEDSHGYTYGSAASSAREIDVLGTHILYK